MNWLLLRSQVLERDKYRCQKCRLKLPKFDVHHIVPVADGGTDDLDNLKTLCRSHHIAVHEEISWVRMLGRAGETFDDLQIRTGFA